MHADKNNARVLFPGIHIEVFAMVYGRPMTLLAIMSALLLASCKRDVAPILPTGNGLNTSPQSPVGSAIINTPVSGQGPTAVLPVALVEEFWAHQTVATMQSFYQPTLGLYKDSWAANANAMLALIDYMKITGNREYLYVIAKVFELNKGTQNFNKDVFAENAQWALVWIAAYDLTDNLLYLNTAKAIADDMDATGWDASTCAGGVITSRTDKLKRAFPTASYIQVMAALHSRIEGDKKYIAFALKGWAWFATSGLINKDKLINAGLTDLCKNDGGPTWNDAQGALLGAAVELAKKYPLSPDYIERAKEYAGAVVDKMTTPEGVLRDPNTAKCGTCLGDERMNKGTLVRSMRALRDAVESDKVKSFLDLNSKKVWNGARSTSDMIGYQWHSAFDSGDLARQATALHLFNATVSKNPYPNILKGAVAQATSCSAMEGAALAVDGDASTKWCNYNSAEGSSLVLDLGETKSIKLFKILHAGAGGEALNYNNKKYEIATGESAIGPWKDVVTATDNTSSATFHKVDLKARFIRLHVTTGGFDNVTRIAEFSAE